MNDGSENPFIRNRDGAFLILIEVHDNPVCVGVIISPHRLAIVLENKLGAREHSEPSKVSSNTSLVC